MSLCHLERWKHAQSVFHNVGLDTNNLQVYESFCQQNTQAYRQRWKMSWSGTDRMQAVNCSAGQPWDYSSVPAVSGTGLHHSAATMATTWSALLHKISQNRILVKIPYALPSALGHLQYPGHPQYPEGHSSSQGVSAPSLRHFPKAACGIFPQFSCMLEVLLPLEIALHVLARHISPREGEYQSRLYVKTGAGEHDPPRKPADFSYRWKRSSPGPHLGLHLYHLSSSHTGPSLPHCLAERAHGLCYFLNHTWAAEDKLMKERRLQTAQHRRLQGSAWGCVQALFSLLSTDTTLDPVRKSYLSLHLQKLE